MTLCRAHCSSGSFPTLNFITNLQMINFHFFFISFIDRGDVLQRNKNIECKFDTAT